MAYGTIKYKVITASEYLVWSYDNYQITQCDDPNYNPVWIKSVPTSTSSWTIQKSSEQIQKCKDDATKNILAKRDYDYKDSVISSSIWWTIFLLLFIFHFPVFLKKYKEDK